MNDKELKKISKKVRKTIFDSCRKEGFSDLVSMKVFLTTRYKISKTDFRLIEDFINRTYQNNKKGV